MNCKANLCINAQLKTIFVFRTFILPPSSCDFQNAEQIVSRQHLEDSYFKTAHVETDQSFHLRRQHLFCLSEHIHRKQILPQCLYTQLWT